MATEMNKYIWREGEGGRDGEGDIEKERWGGREGGRRRGMERG